MIQNFKTAAFLCRKLFIGALAGLTLPAAQAATVGAPLGPEFQVSPGGDSANDIQPQVSRAANGNFVVLYNAYGSSSSCYARLYQADGTASAPAFAVTQSNMNVNVCTVAMNASGDFVVAWLAPTGSVVGLQLYVRRYHADGSANGDAIKVTTFFQSNEFDIPLSVAINSSGDFVLAWRNLSSLPIGTNTTLNFGSMHARIYQSDGTPKTKVFTVSPQTPVIAGPSIGTAPDFEINVGMAPSGDVVFVWSKQQRGNIGARLFSSNGVARGAAFAVSDPKYKYSKTTGLRDVPAIAVDGQGNFVVAWNAQSGSTGNFDVLARRFTANGVAQGSPINISDFAGSPATTSVSIDSAGDFVVTWDELDTNGDGSDIVRLKGHYYHPDGTTIDSEFPIGAYSPVQFASWGGLSSAVDATGNLVATWSRPRASGDATAADVFAQLFSGP